MIQRLTQLLRSTGFNIIMFGSGALLSLYGVFIGRFLPGGALAQARLWGRICLWGLRVCCGIAVEAEGLENLPAGGAVIAAQHQSALDILIWLTLVERPVFVFKKELKRIPLFGSLLEPSGMIPVNRGGGGTALREMVANASKAVAAGRQLVIFPEGTRVAYGVRGQIRNGVVALTQAVTVPVLPAATNAGLRWSRKAYGKSPGPVHVTIYPALPKGLRREQVVDRLEAVFYDGLTEAAPQSP
jgi:1-acyl-sn-glycerol-3-phosphate acyltransferase